MNLKNSFKSLLATAIITMATHAAAASSAEDEHAQIGVRQAVPNNRHTLNPDAQWFPGAGLGLMLSWDEASTRGMNISWPMIPGRALARKKITDPVERARIVRESDYNLDGKPPVITPNEYWAMAKNFNPNDYHPKVWLKKAREAGFTYAVLITKHHNGFALWPSAYGDFNTKQTMGGRDLVKEYVDACRAAGLKIGLYFSGPDWHFDRDYMSFLYSGTLKPNPELPALDADLKPRTTKKTPEEIARHQDEYAAMVNGQIKELLTRYGKIDLMWFDGKPPVGAGKIMSLEQIRALQPGIVVNRRLYDQGDFITPERVLPATLRLKSDEWGEFCSPWNGAWPYTPAPYPPLDKVLTELIRSRAAGVNYIIGIGPMGNGDLAPEAYDNMARLAAWMKTNGESIHGTSALPGGETASVPASSKGDIRYLYLTPGPADAKAGTPHSVSIIGLQGAYRAQWLGHDEALAVTTEGDTLSVALPADTSGPDVSVVKLSPKQK